MDISRFKRACAGLSVAAIMLTQVGTAFAAYSDVPSGVWYGDAVSAFTDAGYLDATQPRFRGGDTATRAEFTKLIVMLNGGLLSTPPAVPSFNDVPTGAWFYAYMEEAAKEGWVRGDNNCYGTKPCNGRPNANINRAEAAALIVRAFGLDSTGAAAQFVDNPSGQWYTEGIQTAADHCVLQGDDSTGRVRPSDNMNRAEMVVMLHRVDQGLTFGVDCGKGQVTAPAVKAVMATSSTTVEIEFTVAMDKTSAETKANYTMSGSPTVPINAAKLIAKDTVELTLGEEMVADHEYTMEVKDVESEAGDKVSGTKTFAGYATIVKGDGELEVSLSSKNPRGDTIPKGAVGVVLLSADFTASCKDKVLVENLTVLHEGFGESTDVDGVYAAVNGARVSRKRTIDAQDQTADLRFSSALVIDPCETVTVDLVADFNSTAVTASEHNFVVELPSDVTSNAQAVTGNFPLRGESFKMAAVTSGIITITYRSVNPSQVQVGDKGVVVGKFEVDADSTEDQTLYSMTFEQNSSASDGDVVNFAIRRTDGTILTNTVAQTVGDFITMVFDPPFTILEGDKITLEVVGDILNGADKSIQMHFEESSDLFAVGSLYGYGVNGQLYGSQVSIPTDNATTVTIDAGEFTIGINGPSTTQYTSDSNDAVLANIEFSTGGEDVDIKNIYMLVLGQTSTGAFMCEDGFGAATAAGCSGTGDTDEIANMMEGVEIRNKTTGRTVSAVRLTTTGTSGDAATAVMGEYQIYRFDDFIVSGKQTWQFRADFTSNTSKHPRNGDKFRIYICGEPTHVLDSSGNLTANTATCSFGGVFGAGGTVTAASTSYYMTVEGLSTGDKVGDVRPRGDIAGNVMEVIDASLTVEVKALSTTESAVENAKDINLFRFEAKASSAEDLLLTKAVFEDSTGGTTDDNASNYSLWVDTDGDRVVDTVLETGIATQSDQITFAELAGGGYVLPKEQTIVFEVHGDVASSLQTTTTLQLRFDTGTSVTYLEAEKLADGTSLSGLKTNGTCASTCDITVTTVYSTIYSLRNQGDLYVSLDSQTIGARQLLGGTLGEPVLRVKMHAEYEDVDVTDFVLNSSGSTAASVDSLELWLDGGTKALAVSGGCGSADVLNRMTAGSANTEASGSGTTAFCFTLDNKQLVVPKGADVKVLVRPRIKTDVNGATSNNQFALFIDHTPASNDSTGTGSVRARGVASSNNLVANDGDATADGEVFIGRTAAATTNLRVIGNANFTVLSKLASITNGGAATGTVPSGADREIGAFTFTAATNGNTKDGANQWVLSGAVFTVNATNVNMATTGFKIYNKAASMSQNDVCTAMTTGGTTIVGTASGVFLVDCRGLIDGATVPAGTVTAGIVNTAVDSGQSITLTLLANVTNTNTAASSGGSSILQVSLNDFTNVTKQAFGQASGQSRLQWRDTDNAANQKFQWIEYPDTAINSTTYRG
ncbi:MAG: S-layer homology domain-containing protein [Candidatus Peribacteraceae bacterium]|nr:S-layer homology domain-containing protein [Candidatus Peribacteraceae bacterium]